MQFLIKEHPPQYRLFVSREDREEDFLWESESYDDCLQIEILYKQWFAFKESVNAKKAGASRTLINGFITLKKLAMVKCLGEKLKKPM